MTTSRGAWVDVLMITYARPHYVRTTLPHLLDQADERTRVWLWHNGEDAETLNVVTSHLQHPRVHRFHHSRDNVKLRPPTNWLWSEASGELVGKVDDDCVVADGWIDRLREAHATYAFGVIGAWRFRPEDWRPDLADAKTVNYPGGLRLLRNLWVQGSGYLVPTSVVREVGPLRNKQSFTQWCLAVERHGRPNGWLLPLIQEEHMDDPLSPLSPLRTDADLQRHLPLSAQVHGVTTLAAWNNQMRRSAMLVQGATLDVNAFNSWRAKRRSAVRRLRRAVGMRTTW